MSLSGSDFNLNSAATSLVMAALLPVLGACLATPGQNVQTLPSSTTDSRECAKNFTYDGSFLRGRTFKTNSFVKDVQKNTAVQRAALYTANSGFTINNSNPELGLISASQTVSYGQGKTAPLNVTISPASGGVRVAMVMSISGGLTTPVEGVRDHFCATVAAIAG